MQGMSDDTQVKRDERGRWIEKPPHTKQYEITHANARTMAEKRWAKFRASANSRILREAVAIDPTIKTPADAYGLLASKQFVALMDYDKPRIDELEKMAKLMTGYEPSKVSEDTAQAQPASADTYNVTLVQILQDVAQSQADTYTNAIEGQAEDVND